jgi:hypothetical protein
VILTRSYTVLDAARGKGKLDIYIPWNFLKIPKLKNDGNIHCITCFKIYSSILNSLGHSVYIILNGLNISL